MRRYEQLLEDYEDAYFALLMDQVAKQEGERLEQQNQELIEDPNFEVPETTDQKCLRTIERCFARQQRQTALRSVTHILCRNHHCSFHSCFYHGICHIGGFPGCDQESSDYG